MGHRQALWLVGPVLLAVAAHLHLYDTGRPPGSSGAPAPPPTCKRRVQVGDPDARLLCLDRQPLWRLLGAGVPRACLGVGAAVRPARLIPGDRIVITRGPTPTCRVGRMAAPAISTLGLPVDINRGSAAELATLPRVGKRLARRIVARRKRHGPFRAPADLLEVRGLGHRLLRRIQPRLIGLPPP